MWLRWGCESVIKHRYHLLTNAEIRNRRGQGSAVKITADLCREPKLTVPELCRDVSFGARRESGRTARGLLDPPLVPIFPISGLQLQSHSRPGITLDFLTATWSNQLHRIPPHHRKKKLKKIAGSPLPRRPHLCWLHEYTVEHGQQLV